MGRAWEGEATMVKTNGLPVVRGCSAATSTLNLNDVREIFERATREHRLLTSGEREAVQLAMESAEWSLPSWRLRRALRGTE